MSQRLYEKSDDRISLWYVAKDYYTDEIDMNTKTITLEQLIN